MYIKENEGSEPIQMGYHQIFRNKFTSSIAKREIINLRNENIITERDVKISEFLFKFRFATLEQLHRFLETDSSVNSIKIRLDKLVKNRVINKFILSKIDGDEFHSDALVFYCLDLGGKFLLSCYSNLDVLDWQTSANMKSSNIISKDILTTEFYLRLLEHCPEKIVFFNPRPTLRSDKDKINIEPTFECCLKSLGQNKYFIGEVVREFDLPIDFREKADKLDRLLSTYTWKKYYYDTEEAPILLLFTESDVLAKDVATIVSKVTSIENYRLSTDERIKKPLDSLGVLLEYKPDKGQFKQLRANIFAKKE